MDEKEVAQDADALALLTEWKQFRFLDLAVIKNVMRGKAFFDARNQYQPKAMSQKGFDYFSIGRAPIYADHNPTTVDVIYEDYTAIT